MCRYTWGVYLGIYVNVYFYMHRGSAFLMNMHCICMHVFMHMCVYECVYRLYMYVFVYTHYIYGDPCTFVKEYVKELGLLQFGTWLRRISKVLVVTADSKVWNPQDRRLGWKTDVNMYSRGKKQLAGTHMHELDSKKMIQNLFEVLCTLTLVLRILRPFVR